MQGTVQPKLVLEIKMTRHLLPLQWVLCLCGRFAFYWPLSGEEFSFLFFFFFFPPWYFLKFDSCVLTWSFYSILCSSPVLPKHGSFAPFSPKGHWRLCNVHSRRSFFGTLFVIDLEYLVQGSVMDLLQL